MSLNTKTIPRHFRTRATLLSGLFVVVAFSLTACGESNVQYSNGAGPGGSGGAETPNRYNTLPPIDLAVGEALPGIHLRPGIELHILTAEETLDTRVNWDEMTVELFGSARVKLEQADEVWSGDIISSDEFIFRIKDVEAVDEKLVIDVYEFELLDVIHGEWNYTIQSEWDGSYDIQDNAPGVRRQGLEAVVSDQEHEASVKLGELLGADIEARVSVGSSIEVRGSMEFPVSWAYAFEGRIPLTDSTHACATTTETRTRTRLTWRGFQTEEYQVEVTPQYFCVDLLVVKGEVGLNSSFGFTSTVNGTIGFSVSKDTDFPGIPVPLGPTGLALYFEPFVEGGFEIDFTGETVATFDASRSVNIPMGFEYDRATYGFALIPNERYPISNGGQVIATTTDVLRGTSKLYAKGGFKLHLATVLENAGKATGRIPFVDLSDISAKLTGPEIGVEVGVDAEYTREESAGESSTCIEAHLYAKLYGKAQLSGEVKLSERWKWRTDFTGAWTPDQEWIWASYYNPSPTGGFAPRERGLGCSEERVQLEVTLSWTEETDLDLFLETPSGEVLHYRNRNAAGGTFLGDACINGDCEGDLTETIAWENGAVAPSGQYKTWVVNYNGAAAASYTISVVTDSGTQNFSGNVAGSRGARSSEHTFSVGAP